MTHITTRVAAIVVCLLTPVFAPPALAQTAACPCSLWPAGAAPFLAAVTDNQPIEVGVKFTSEVDGFVTALRFYKGTQNTGVHVGHLWSAAGALLATATFAEESASGWQDVLLTPAVAITANATYVASYHSDGYFAIDSGYFADTGVDAPPLHAPRAGIGGANGVFAYGASTFPASGGSNNYWVDVVFQTDLGPDVTPPTVSQVTPPAGSTGIALSARVQATFSEVLDASTVAPATFVLRDPDLAVIGGSVTYDAALRTATFATTAGLLPNAIYTATIHGGPSGVRDRAGNPLAADVSWSFTTGAATPPPDDGPGGPILIISSTSNPFGRYYSEILRAEGLNEFLATDISNVTASLLASHEIVILGEMPLTAAQVAMLANYVHAGGNLVAMRPDKQLAALLGLMDQDDTLSNAYLQVDTASAPGAGIVGDTIQFHGAADRYAVSSAATVATLFSDAVTGTSSPAVTLAAVGSAGGHAAAFTFDLARSIVYTRQGNPAWSGQERDGTAPIRSDDLFFGAASADPQPDWVDLNKVAIPQADEQQRLLANLLLHLNRARTPLPRFWYLPRGLKAAIVMTGDDHGNGGTVGRFNQYAALSAPGCSVADWQCIRGTSYVYNGTPGMDDASSAAFADAGFEVALHVSSNCADWTAATLATFYSQQLAQFRAERPSVPVVRTNRTHCIAWSDYVSQPKIELANGIRFDTNYYYWPEGWVQNRPGLFTGSGMPMRFADVDGSTIDVYQATSQMTDESGQIYPFTADTLLDRALGPLGFYGVFTANHHTDQPTEQQSDATVASAIARGVPVVTASQMLDWLDGRNGSSFGSIAWSQGALTFSIAADARANGLTAMIPTVGNGGALTALTRDGVAVAVTRQVIKGIEYAFFAAAPGSYVATYFVDATPPAISTIVVTAGTGNTATVRWATDEPSDSRVEYGSTPTTLTNAAGSGALVTSHSVVLTSLTPLTTYYFRVVSTDAAGNSASSAVNSFTTPSTLFSASDTSSADFGAGSGSIYIAQAGDGEVTLAPAAGSEFNGGTLPADWSVAAWNPGGSAVVANGTLTVDGARAGTALAFAPGRSLEFVATFSGAPFQHAGFADTLDGAPWIIFSTGGGGALFARTNSGSGSVDTALPSALLNSPHRFRIDWTPASETYSVDGVVVASHAIAVAAALRPLASDFSVGSGVLTLDWLRLGPYADTGTFNSRIFDAGDTVNWGTLSWTAPQPAGTTVAFFERHGDTPAPDATWSAFAPVAAPGAAIAATSRYLQYRVDLATADAAATPEVDDVTIGYSAIPPNHPPAAAADSYSGTQDTPLTIGAPGVLVNDSDADGDPLSAMLASAPAHGALTFAANGSFTYTPVAGYFGPDSFSYTASDGKEASAPATVTLTIAADGRAPITAGDSYATNEDTALVIAAPGVLANDVDPLGRALTAVLVRAPLNGTLTKFAANGSFRYKPNPNYNGSDTFVYRAAAGVDQSIDTTVTLTVNPVNDAPVAADDIYRNDEGHTLDVAAPGILGNDTDVDGDVLTAVLMTRPVHGKLTFRADGSFTYVPNSTWDGSDSFTYKASDGVKKSPVTTVTITGLASNRGFVAQPDSYTTSPGVPLAVAAPGVLVNDIDPDGESLTAVLGTPPAHGTLTLDADGSFVYVPEAGFAGTDTFIYRAMDEVEALTDPTIVDITVR